MFAPLRRWLPLALVVLAAFWLRTHELDRRPMHADEANQAVKTGELLETGRYVFDPTDHHGPSLYYAALPVAWLRGEHTLNALSETTVRLVPALAGTLSVLLLYLLCVGGALRPDSAPDHPALSSHSSRPTAVPLTAAVFFAISPPAVYYSRYFVQETLLLAFVLALLVAAQHWWLTGRLRWAILAGVCLGLAQATKATTPFFLILAALAVAVVRPPRPAAAKLVRPLALALLAALVVICALYSSFGTHLAGLNDALETYRHAFSRATGASGHEKPWWYYLRLFGWIRDGGLVFHQLLFTGLALAGVVLAFLPRRPRPPEECHIMYDIHPRSPHVRAGAAYLLLLAAAFSLTPYKTPWHAIHFVPPLALLAAAALAALPRWWLGGALAGLTAFLQLGQTNLTSFLRPADARNPYAYVHSAPDVLKVHTLAADALARSPDAIVRIISEEYWPLPWYLRDLPRTGYWTRLPENCDASLVITSETHADAVRAQLHGGYRESLLGLRPGFLLIVFTPEP